VLVSTGPVPYGEFCFVPEGEMLANFGVVCCNSATCGCNRSISGTETFKATSTAKVVEREISWNEMFELAAKVGKETGWGGPIVWGALKGDHEAIKDIEVGTVVEAHYNDETEAWEYIPVNAERLEAADV
jgi:hypothetical protein